MYKLIFIRYGKEDSHEFETQAEALAFARWYLATDAAYPLDIYKDGELVATNRDGSPLIDGTTPLLEMIDKADW